MPSSYKVTDPLAPRKAADPLIGALTEQMLHEVQSRTPVASGKLRAGWRVQHGDNYAVYLISNDVEYAKFVEYGTKNRPATPMLGPVLAAHRGASL